MVTMVISATTITKAQDTEYHGEINISGGLGFGDTPAYALEAHTIHGICFSECFSMGAGIGATWNTNDMKSGTMMLPVFADFKMYVPTAGDFDPYLLLDVGYTFELKNREVGGVLYAAGIGFKASVFNFSICYNYLQQISTPRYSRLYPNAIKLRIGVAF